MVNTQISVGGGRQVEFPWGDVKEIHRIELYDIVEYINQENEVWFHPYVNGKDTNVSLSSLDKALLAAIDYRNNGFGSHASRFAALVLELGGE